MLLNVVGSVVELLHDSQVFQDGIIVLIRVKFVPDDVKMVNVNHEFVLSLKRDSKDVHGGEM